MWRQRPPCRFVSACTRCVRWSLRPPIKTRLQASQTFPSALPPPAEVLKELHSRLVIAEVLAKPLLLPVPQDGKQHGLEPANGECRLLMHGKEEKKEKKGTEM